MLLLHTLFIFDSCCLQHNTMICDSTLHVDVQVVAGLTSCQTLSPYTGSVREIRDHFIVSPGKHSGT